MASFAVWHIGIEGKRYKPGERLPEMDDATWKRLAQMGAIRAEYEANPLTSADLAQSGETTLLKGEPASGGPREDDEPEEDDEAEDEELPEIDAAEGIVEEDEKPARRKKARA